MTTTLQVRQKPPKLATRAVEFRATEEISDGRTLEGYAAVFNSVTTIDSWYGTHEEEIAPGAFRRTLRARRPVLQFDHGHDRRTGSIPIGAIEDIREDEHGLFVRARLFDNELVEPIRQAIEAGAISGMSFRFRIVREEWRDKDGKLVKDDELIKLLWEPGDRGPLRRTIREVELFEVGPVVFPAYTDTSVGVRALLADLDADERQRLLRELLADVQPEQPPAPQIRPEPAPQGTSGDTRTADPAPAGHSAPTPITTPRSKSMTTQTMSVDERRARLEEIRARLAEIDAEFAGGEMDDEARAEWDGLVAEHERHERAIADVEARRARLAQLAGNPAAVEQPKRDWPTSVVVNRSAADIYDLTAIRQQARSIDDLGRLYRDNALRAIERARFGAARGISREDAQTQAERLLDVVDDDQGTLARRMLVTGSPTYERAFGRALLARSTAGLTGDEQRALSLGVDADGGFAVPFQLDPTVILTSAGSTNPLRQVARVEQIVGKEWQGITSAGIVVTRSPEAQEATDNSPTFSQPTVRPTRVLGFVPFSMEIDQDWSRMRAELTRLLADAKDQEEAESFVNGTGTGDQPHGIVATLQPSSRVPQTGAAGSFSSDDVYAVEEALPPRFRARASWLANKSIYNRIRRFDTNGGADLWVRLGAGMPAELIGYPARELSTMDGTIEATGGGNNLVLMLGDYETGFLIVDRIGMSVELVPHLFGASNRFPTGQRGIVAMWRNSSRILTSNAIRILNVVSPA